MKFMLHCRKFCAEIRVSRVANNAETGKLACPGCPCPKSTSTNQLKTPVARTGSPGQAGLKNVGGQAQRRRQYASTARSCNAAIGIFSGPRLRPAFSTSTNQIKTPVTRTGSPGQAGLKNVEGQAQRRRQYASTARSCNAAIGIFSGPRLRPAVVKPCAYKCIALLNLAALAPKPPLCAARLYNLSFPSHTASLPCQHN